jgi:xyloglucan-specific exo-beta-1,4-glucanase
MTKEPERCGILAYYAAAFACVLAPTMLASAATPSATMSLAARAAATASAAPRASYIWRNVTVGGGGFAPDIIFSRAQRGLAYLRTDMGGVYRWSERRQRWIPLEDGIAQASYFGIESVAADPVDANVVYVAAGMYAREPAAILRSEDRGRTWQIFPTAFRMGGNEPGRGVGERLVIDPSDRSILYFGSRYDGLQRSTDRGETWSRVASFPVHGMGWRAAPRGETGISFVVIDPKSGHDGRPSRRIFVGVTDAGSPHLFRSDDAGSSWTAVAGQPRAALLPVHGELDSRGVLYITYSNGVGPNGVTDGAVFSYDTRSGHWTDITPERGPHRAPGGYMGLGVDPERPGTVVVATLNRWHPGDILWRTTDGGHGWRNLRALSRRDVSATPFLLWGRPQADFGWWMAGVAIDPFDSGHVAYSTGATVYATRDLLAADRGRRMLWKPWVRGVEQTAVLTLLSPPQGPHLLSGFGDISGFAHEDLSRSPKEQFTHPVFSNTDEIDYAGLDPRVVVRGGTRAPRSAPGAPTLAYSLNYGRSWQPLQPHNAASVITVSADGHAFVVTAAVPFVWREPFGVTPALAARARPAASTPVSTTPPLVTFDRGRTWTAVRGLPAGAHPIADKVARQTFYALDFKHAELYVSTDGGRTFHQRLSRGLPATLTDDVPTSPEQQWPLIATPGRRGDLWLVAHEGLFHSTDAGRSFARVDGGIWVVDLSFGKARPGRHYPALYAIGVLGTTNAIWRSDDEGASWLRINDARHEYGREYRCIAGDPRIFGRVYVGTDGRGIVYGEPRG